MLKIKYRSKAALAYLIIFMVTLFFFPVSVQAKENIIVINPGHSVGYDPGNTSYKVSEAEINEILAGRIVKKLSEQGYKVYITHTTDSSLASQKLLTQAGGDDLKTVAKAINKISPDLTISIHHNSGTTTSSGAEIYWSSYRDFDTEGVYTVEGLWGSGEEAYRDKTPSKAALDSKNFAQILKNSFSSSQLGVRSVVERDDYIPAHTTSASVLYEGGFLSNPTEAEYLASESYISDATNRMVNAVGQYFGSTSTGGNNSSSGSESTGTTGNVTTKTKIMGSSDVTVDQLVSFYNTHSGISFPQYYQNRGISLNQFAQIYIDEARTENVRADVAFAQAMLETGFLKFGGDVSISQFNFAGLGATGNGVRGEDFAATYGDNATGIRMGIRAQIQHLKAYASTESLKQACVDSRFSLVSRGSAPTIGDLTGKWATDPDYGPKIVNLINQIPKNSSGSSVSSIPIYRLYNPVNGEHLYTSDKTEATVLSTQAGWTDEGTGWKAPTTGIPVYRLYSPVTGNHLYTTDQNEVVILTTQSGWSLDNNGNPLFYSGGNNAVYRLYNETLRQHHLTTDFIEYNILPANGWKQEGTALNSI